MRLRRKARPAFVTFDHNDDIMYWSTEEHALRHVQLVGGFIQDVPRRIVPDEDWVLDWVDVE